MDRINSNINGNRFIPIDRDELSALELIAKVKDKTNELVDKSNIMEQDQEEFKGNTAENLNKKVSYDDMVNKYKMTNHEGEANYNGAWQGLKKPTLSQEGAFAQVEKNQDDITELNNIYGTLRDYKQYKNGDDWSEPLRRAIADGKRSIYLGKGKIILGNIDVPSDIEIYGHPTETIVEPLAGGRIFNIKGTIKNTSWLTLDADDFGKTLESHDGALFSSNEFIMIKSQRNAIDENACGKLWTLGYPTNANDIAFFGEFKQIEKIHGNTIHLRDYLTFPFYYKDNSREPAGGSSGDKTYIYSLNLVENVKIHDFRVKNMSSAIFETDYARNIQIYNIDYTVDDYNGEMMNYFNITRSFDCNVKNCRFDRIDIVVPKQHHYVNVYKIASSQNIHFENCYGKNATQTFDASYKPNDIVSNNFTVKNCEFISATQTGMTTHGGTYKAIIIGNTILDCRQGIGIRTRASVISNNNINNYYADDTVLRYGICLYEGHAKNCVISNNSITNAHYGVLIGDGGYEGEWFKGCDSSIVGNVFSNCKYGVGTYKVVSNKIVNNDYNILVASNTFILNRASSRAVFLVDYTSGFTINDNIIINLNTVKQSGIWASYDVYNCVVMNNTIVNCSTGVFFRGLQALANNSEVVKTIFTNRNMCRQCDTENSIHVSLNWYNESSHNNITFLEQNNDTTKIKNSTLFINANNEVVFKDFNGTVKKLAYQ